MGGISIMSWIWCNKKRLRWDEIPIFLVHTKRSLPFLLIWVRISFSAPATSQRFFYSKQLSFACISVRELQPSISIKLNQKATKTNIHLGTSAQNFVIISHRNPASFCAPCSEGCGIYIIMNTPGHKLLPCIHPTKHFLNVSQRGKERRPTQLRDEWMKKNTSDSLSLSL